MKKNNWIIFTAVLVLLFTAAMPVFASADSSVCMELPVETTVSGGFPQEAETFNLTLTADTPNAPMPAGSIGGVYSFTSTGNHKQILEVRYPKLGIYRYTLAEEKGSNKTCHYDSSVYSIEVSVTNSERGDDIEITVAINRDNEDEKCPGVTFNNKYDYPPSDKKPRPKTGDESDMALWMSLMAMSAVCAAVVLRKKNN